MRYPFLLLCLLCCTVSLTAQPDTIRVKYGIASKLIVLDSVSIISPRQQAIDNDYSSSINQIKAYNQLFPMPARTVSDVLSNALPIFMKQYGAGTLSTIALRGTGASQTAVLWNGLELNSPMLGLTDFNLLSGSAFESIYVIRGGESSRYGSSSMGGSIVLENYHPGRKGWHGRAQLGAASFNTWGGNLRLEFYKARYAGRLQVFSNHALNNYPYKDYLGQSKRLPNALSKSLGIMQENFIHLNDKQRLEARLWWQSTYRQIPPLTVQTTRRAAQEDATLRALLAWRGIWNDSTQSKVQIAYLREKIVYADSAIALFSNSSSERFVWQAEHNFKYKQHLFQFVLAENYTRATTVNYGANPHRLQSSANAYWGYLIAKQLSTELRLRLENIDGTFYAPTASIFIEKGFKYGFKLQAKAARNFRLPTFNDLFWLGGSERGNPNLKPETSYSQDLSLVWNKESRKWNMGTRFNVNNQNIKDLIQWQQNNLGNWQPQNLSKVWARGAELEGHLDYKLSGYNKQVFSKVMYAYTHSTEWQSSEQLMYVPLHELRASIGYNAIKYNLSLNYRYGGLRYTTTTNTRSLPAYHLLNLNGRYTIEFKKGSYLYLGLELNNITNRTYVIMENRPMPGFNWATNIQFNF